jgi:hypothetical protein
MRKMSVKKIHVKLNYWIYEEDSVLDVKYVGSGGLRLRIVNAEKNARPAMPAVATISFV